MPKMLMIYPFNIKISHVARYAHQLSDYKLSAIVSPQNSGFAGKDISFVDRGNDTGLYIKSSFSGELIKCDSILFCSTTYLMDMEFYKEKIIFALNAGKEVLVTRELASELFEEGIVLPCEIVILGNNNIKPQFSYDRVKHIKEIAVPIIMFFQVGSYCNGFDNLMLLSNKLSSQGYCVSKISSRDICQLFNINIVPNYIYENQLSYEDKIINLSHYIYLIANEENADIILIDIEEAIMPYNDHLTNHFGIIPNIVGKAVQCDIGILNCYYDHFNKNSFDNLRNFCKYALNTDIDYFNISNYSLSIQEMNEEFPIKYIPTKWNDVIHTMNSEYASYEECEFFNLYDEESINFICNDIISRLSENENTLRV